MTPEERMREALHAALVAYLTAEDPIPGDGSFIVEHGAAAIREALAEQREMLVAWLRWLEEQYGYQGDLGGYADDVAAGEPEAWAARTGWEPG